MGSSWSEPSRRKTARTPSAPPSSARAGATNWRATRKRRASSALTFRPAKLFGGRRGSLAATATVVGGGAAVGGGLPPVLRRVVAIAGRVVARLDGHLRRVLGQRVPDGRMQVASGGLAIARFGVAVARVGAAIVLVAVIRRRHRREA